MTYLTVNSVELEANSHPGDYHSTLSGHTGSKKSVVITPSEEEKISKHKNRPGLHKEPKSTKGSARTGLQK